MLFIVLALSFNIFHTALALSFHILFFALVSVFHIFHIALALSFHIFNCRPAYATPKILDKNNLTLKDIDVFEFHEAFAVSFILKLKYYVM